MATPADAAPDLEVQQFEMKLKQFASTMMMKEDWLHGVPEPEIRVERAVDSMLNTWSIYFRKHLPTRELLDLRWPTDWWQAVKNRWAPGWWLRRWPVRWEGVDLTQVVAMEVPRNIGHPVFYAYETKHGVASEPLPPTGRCGMPGCGEHDAEDAKI